MPRTRPSGVSRHPAVLLVGGTALLLCLVVTQAFLPVLRRPATPPATRIQNLVTSPLVSSSTVSSPALPPTVTLPIIPATTPFASVMDLAAAGRFSAALPLALALSPEQAPAALASLFALWARQAPYDAAAAALAEPAARDHAWPTVVATWSATAPAALAAHSLTLPVSEEPARRHALDAAVTRWLVQDAPAAMEWVGRLPSGPETDGAVARVALHPDLLHAQPDLAVSWAESIQDHALRSRILGRVVRVWRDSTPAALAAAEHYARTSPDLLPSEREDILVGERFTAHP